MFVLHALPCTKLASENLPANGIARAGYEDAHGEEWQLALRCARRWLVLTAYMPGICLPHLQRFEG